MSQPTDLTGLAQLLTRAMQEALRPSRGAYTTQLGVTCVTPQMRASPDQYGRYGLLVYMRDPLGRQDVVRERVLAHLPVVRKAYSAIANRETQGNPAPIPQWYNTKDSGERLIELQFRDRIVVADSYKHLVRRKMLCALVDSVKDPHSILRGDTAQGCEESPIDRLVQYNRSGEDVA